MKYHTLFDVILEAELSLLKRLTASVLRPGSALLDRPVALARPGWRVSMDGRSVEAGRRGFGSIDGRTDSILSKIWST